MKTRSAKNKGKRLEKWLRERLLELFPELSEDDLRITVGSETGADLKLSKKAKEVLPYKFECKNRETFKTLYGFYEQACEHEGTEEPIVIIKMNHKEPLVILDAEYFLNLVRNNNAQ